jgi:hypothetical protein
MPTLTVPIAGETLVLYLAVSREPISSVLMTERNNVQRPIYFVSKAFQGPELNYPLLEKLTLALVYTARRLHRYFQAHVICVLTDQPIRQVLLKPENFGRLAKWAIELGEHDITYKPRSVIKEQVIADFIAETPRYDSPNEHEGATTSKPKAEKKNRYGHYTSMEHQAMRVRGQASS